MDLSKIFLEESQKNYFVVLQEFINNEYATKNIYPPYSQIYNAFKYVDGRQIKVVILGQDPYYNPKQAHGLAFSVQEGIPLPKSLENIYKELKNDLGINKGSNGNLSGWAEQGVFLLNTILTVCEGNPLSHKDKGWETFTLAVIKALNDDMDHKVFVLWGLEAKKYKDKITNNIHLIIESSHPSPLSAYHGFTGSKPFSKINEFLFKHQIEGIDWSK